MRSLSHSRERKVTHRDRQGKIENKKGGARERPASTTEEINLFFFAQIYHTHPPDGGILPLDKNSDRNLRGDSGGICILHNAGDSIHSCCSI